MNKVIYKFTLNNILEKKIRTCLMICSILVFAAMLLSSLTLKDALVLKQIEINRQNFGDADLIIKGKAGTFFKPYRKNNLVGLQQYRAVDWPVTYEGQDYESVHGRLLGIDLRVLQKFNPIYMVEYLKDRPFKSKYIILDQAAAKKENLNLGEKVYLNVNGEKVPFMVWGICTSKGLFAGNKGSFFAVTDKEGLASLLGKIGQSNLIYVDLGKHQIKDVYKSIKQHYRNQTIELMPTEEELSNQVSGISVVFQQFTLMIFIISGVICGFSFKLIMKERLRKIGILRSLGATKKMVIRIAVLESLFYGSIGGALGIVLGMALLQIISNIIIGSSFNFGVIRASYILLTLVLSMMVSVLSSIIPIIKSAKVPIKEVILRQHNQNSTRRGALPVIAAVLLLVVGSILPRVVNGSVAISINSIALIIPLVAGMLLVPYVVEVVSGILAELSKAVNNKSLLSFHYIKNDIGAVNSIKVMALSISVLLLILMTGKAIVLSSVDHYSNTIKYDIELSMAGANQGAIEKIGAMDGVEGVQGAYNGQAKIVESDANIRFLQGVNEKWFSEYWDYKSILNGLKGQNLNTERVIILSKALQYRLGVKKGDNLTLMMGGGKRHYKVIGFFLSVTAEGSHALIGEKFLKIDSKLNNYTNIYIKTRYDADQVVRDIKEFFGVSVFFINTRIGMMEQDQEGYGQMIKLLNILLGIIMVMVGFGISNNLLISLLERETEISTLRSIGMSKKQLTHMILVEALVSAFIAGGVGILLGSLLISIMPFTLKALNQPPVQVIYSVPTILTVVIINVWVTMLATILPAIKQANRDIVESIKELG